MKKILMSAALLAISATAQAAVETYTFNMLGNGTGGVTYNNASAYSSLSFSDRQGSNTITADMTAWSDTYGDNDDIIKDGNFYKWYSDGWGIVNDDESSSDDPGHSIDNTGWWADYDFILVEFSESVELSGIDLGWDYGSTADLSFVALGDSAPIMDGKKWSDFTGYDSFNETINDSYSGNDGYYQLDSGLESTYWLVGAYNHIFGDCLTTNNDGFKLAGLQVKASSDPSGRPIPAPEPASLAVFGLGMLGLMWQRKRNA
ncbi:exosortase-dependent surface protein XDP1 [Catenovulum sediminis]|uniref:Exosortase-dependent surface protein XDP1 n=1 Tax=Catenovulum sediminis TaxID=1740262 RepID=A0ABV1RMB9_9ALTE|nr:exosortase-dependent surface protein XDP1 [Catenovulum sediminis]